MAVRGTEPLTRSCSASSQHEERGRTNNRTPVSEANLKNFNQSQGRGKDGKSLEWSVMSQSVRKTKLEHSVGKNTTGRLMFKEIHKRPTALQTTVKIPHLENNKTKLF